MAVNASLPMAKVDFVMNNNTTADTTTAPIKSTSSAANVRVVRFDEYKAAALSIAEAFEDDHVSRYFIDTPDREGWTKQQKWDLHVKIMEYITYAHLLKGLVLSAGPNYDCVALW
jgi:hypothetical protein